MKVCLIGLGNWGKNHARILGAMKNNNHIDEIYFYDEDKNKAHEFAKRYDAKVPDNLESLDVDAVDIVVPADLHYKVSKPFLERGIKTFIEKPFTDNEKNALELIDTCKRPEEQIMIGHIFRFHSGVKLAKELIDNGSIGEILKMDIRRLAFGKPRPDNGVIFSLAIHDLDLFCYFSNDQDPEEISCITSTIVGPTEDHAFIKLNYENAVGIAEESWMSPSTGKIRSCSIQGTLGEISFDFSKPSEVHINSIYIDDRINDLGKFSHTIPFVEPLSNEIEQFLSCAKNNKPFPVGPDIGLRAVKLCSKALESAELKQSVKY